MRFRFPFVSRRRFEDAARQVRGWRALFARIQSGAVARELDAIRDEVALHIVAADHPSSALSDARSMALSLREALEARGVDLRPELERLEGAEL